MLDNKQKVWQVRSFWDGKHRQVNLAEENIY